ncbi:MAG: bifunctional demethylmenaquinone methyltransferase/2-methoxy-6-polyprenyl-1,4-benzoquinol methylase UbiE [Rickettsiaceae bacterium]|nr:bifunctional demethylmenaquinone methyltransferase/2-methoxy-6-polyprenyl-1,4-benzoquinol methylase UbiE [Rickettsiaceae bacterium]
MIDKEQNNNFGFQKVSNSEKRSLVGEVFSDVAKNYDVMNDLMSFSIHRLWKDKFCKLIPNLNSTILDVAGGTGDIAFRLKKKANKAAAKPQIIVCDINKDMLKMCRSKAIDNNILNNFDLITGDAEKLPFTNNSFDYYTICFGIRNVVSIDKALQEAYRVLKPTGKFLCMEFSKVENNLLKTLYNFYSFNIIPKVGKFVANNESAYQYLAESISLFPNQEDFKTKIQQAGFVDVKYENLNSGIVAIHSGLKI